LRFFTLAILAIFILAPCAAAATKEETDGGYLLYLKRQRDGWLWETPGSAVVWQAFMDEAKVAEKSRDYQKQLLLLEAAVEHSSAFRDTDPKRLETVTKIKEVAQKLGKDLTEKDVHELILPITNTHVEPKYKLKPLPRKTPFKPVEPMIQEADLLAVEGDQDKAVAVYLKTLKNLNERTSRKGHELVKVVDRLTRIYYKQGKLADAEIIIRKELKLRESMWDRLDDTDPDKLQLAFLLGDLALVHSGQDRLIESEALYKTALKIIHRNLTENHYDYIVTLSDLARIHKLMGRYAEAEKEYRNCLALAKKSDDVSRQARGVIIGNYAKLLRKMGKVRSAEEMETRASNLLAGSGVPVPADMHREHTR
jgi:tetratricopeptide (TPR) repeat protein